MCNSLFLKTNRERRVDSSHNHADFNKRVNSMKPNEIKILYFDCEIFLA